MDDNRTVFGVDSSQAAYVIAQYGVDGVMRVNNELSAVAAWLHSIAMGSIIAIEATGAYHKLLASLAHASGMQVYVINPYSLKHYAKGVGQRGKTDPSDAQTIARYAQHELAKLIVWQPPSAESDKLAQLLQRRDRLVAAKKMLSQSLAGVAALKLQRQSLTASLKRMIANIELLMRAELARAPALAQLHRRLCTIVGVGFVVAMQLVVALTRVRFKRVDSFIAYTGLDPQPDDSGKRRGRRILTKHGHKLLRHLLYTAGMAAARSKLFKPTYLALRARGLQSTEAMVILARKIGRIAFALYRSGEVFDPQKHLKTA
jgi:transposase